MQKTTKHAIAGLLSAAGAVLTALAAELGVETTETTTTPETPKRRGRPPTTPAPAETAPPAATEPEPAANTGKSYEELRAMIEPFVKEGRGEEVKKIIAKYSSGGLKTMEAKHHADFEKDLAGLNY